jgi:glyoxylase-like metal-dependent hydrolase (beta-lactamase superfamily II)
MTDTITIEKSAIADAREADDQRDDLTHEVAPDVAYKRLGIVNIAFFGKRCSGNGNWVLIDAGLPGTAGAIKRAADARFGENGKPAAIIMTHAHADHAGALEHLARDWDVPIYAFELELPYLNGTASYPPPDTHVGGGMMPALSVLFPRGPFNVTKWLQPLPGNGEVPAMPGWRWIHTPGHTPGHISLWRASDRTLIVGDAFVTTRQESVYAAMTQKPEMHGPPMYYTQNFSDAEASVQKLASLEPELVITGHGKAMRGPVMREALFHLARNFKAAAVPEHGQYVEHPTSVVTGTAYAPARR